MHKFKGGFYMQKYNMQEFKKFYGINSKGDINNFLDILGVSPKILGCISIMNTPLSGIFDDNRELVMYEKNGEFLIQGTTTANSNMAYLLSAEPEKLKYSTVYYDRKTNGVIQYGQVETEILYLSDNKVNHSTRKLVVRPKKEDQASLMVFGSLSGADIMTPISFNPLTLEASTDTYKGTFDLIKTTNEFSLLKKKRIQGLNILNGIELISDIEDMDLEEPVKVKKMI